MSATTKNWVDNSPPQCAGQDLNGFKNENNLLITSTAQALNTADNLQTTKAVQLYGSLGNFYNETGSGNVYTLVPINRGGTGYVAPPFYGDGLFARFVATHTNTAAATLSITGLSSHPILKLDGTPLAGGEIEASTYTDVIYDVATTSFYILNSYTPFENSALPGEVRGPLFNPTIPAGWIRYIDGTIGSASSGATIRANADTQVLYTVLWNNCNDTDCPVSGGRGANAAADFAANKTITLPYTQECTFINYGGILRIGQNVGEATHALTAAENGVHNHSMGRVCGSTGGLQFQGGPGMADISPATGLSGSGLPHNNIPPSTAAYFLMKL